MAPFIKIIGDIQSTRTRKVLMAARETSTPFRMVNVNLALHEHKRTEHLKVHPFARVPAIDDDGFVLYECRAICRYLNERSRGTLLPVDVRARGRVEQWASIESEEFSPHVMPHVFTHLLNIPVDGNTLNRSHKALALTLDVMNTSLEHDSYLSGPDFTLGDLFFMPYMEYALLTPLSSLIHKHDNVMRWWSNISKRDTWQATVAPLTSSI